MITLKLPFIKLKQSKLSSGKVIDCSSKCNVKDFLEKPSTFVKIYRICTTKNEP